jgi:hypothetical protein
MRPHGRTAGTVLATQRSASQANQLFQATDKGTMSFGRLACKALIGLVHILM